ncbi:MAG: hypothetical protein P1P84_04545 [Deferrisomatales bacterium]|nr:hypothetical protein [Deferrisomatales bacterium]
MTRKDLAYFAALVVVGALLFANLLKPSQPLAFTLPEAPVGAGPGVAISGDQDSAWVVVGNTVYYVSLKSRGEVEKRTINVIDDEVLR